MRFYVYLFDISLQTLEPLVNYENTFLNLRNKDEEKRKVKGETLTWRISRKNAENNLLKKKKREIIVDKVDDWRKNLERPDGIC